MVLRLVIQKDKMGYIEEESIRSIVDKFVNDDYKSEYGLLKGHYCRPPEYDDNYSKMRKSMRKSMDKVKTKI